MSRREQTSPVVAVPEHLHTVTPRLVVRDGARAIEFYREAFAAQEVAERFTSPNGDLIHAEIRIGDSVVMLTDEADDGAPAKSPESLGGVVSAIMATYWPTSTQHGSEPWWPAPRWSTRWRISSTVNGPGDCAIRSGSSGCSANESRLCSRRDEPSLGRVPRVALTRRARVRRQHSSPSPRATRRWRHLRSAR
jgi:Glyoxalase/Bleomycin resistance protein/Dioxygenase superfamily